jgi:uncharacterized protein involved in exopolysaccharide biosynthesis
MDIKQGLAVIWRQRVVVGAVLLIGVVVFAFVVGKNRKYTATASILAVSSTSQDAAVLDPRKDPTQSAIAPVDIPNLLASATLVAQVGRDLHLSKTQTQKLGSSIKSKPSLGSDVLPVTVTDTEPDRAIAEANAVVRELQKFEERIATSRYDLLIKDLHAQLGARRTALAAIDQKVDALTASDPYVNDTTGTAAISTRLVALETQRDQLQATLRGDTSAAGLIAQRPALTRDLASQEIIKDDPVFQSLRTQYGKDLAHLNNEQAGYTDRFPGLTGLNDQVTREGKSLAQTQARATANPSKSTSYVAAQLDQNKAQASVVSDQAQLAAVERQIGAMQSHLDASRPENMSLASLRRDREAGNQAYAQLSDRLAAAQADRAQAASINTIVLLDAATAAAPALLSRPAVIAAALGAIFLWLAITLAFIADGTDSRLRTRTTIEELYGSPVFTSVG